ncbi:MAG: glycosyltransferase family 2 protein [Lachnospiraceae bacterium]|nr:glycosyltransferase family 2 protein [Lachnospiraceae bacterium]
MNENRYLVIIPAFNEAENIGRIVNEVRNTAPGFDILVVNDCSEDNTREELLKCGCNCIDLSNNLGIGGAMQTGYKWADDHGYDVAVQIDGDGQHDPSYLEEMVKIIGGGTDMVIGSRYIDRRGYQSTAPRRAGIRYFSRLIGMLTGQTVTDPTSGMRAVGKELIRVFAGNYPADYPEPESTVLAIKKGYSVSEIPVEMRERHSGSSSIAGVMPLYYMIKVTIGILSA